MIKCPGCGGEVEFKPGQKKVVCQYCGTKFNPEEKISDVKVAKENAPIDTYSGKTYSCTQCGATLMTFDETAITFCSYCGSQAMIEEKMIKQNNPDFIIPFEKTKEECIAAYKKKVNSAIFAPSYMKSDVVVEKFRGIYMPYAVYKLGCHGKVTNKGEKYSHREGDYQIYDEYTITADVNTDYDGISFDLVSKFYDKFSASIPFNYKLRKDFNPNYLTGFYADTYDVDMSVYDSEAIDLPKDDLTNKLRKNGTYGKFGCSQPKAQLQVEDRKVGMFPVYFLAIRDKSNKKVNYAVVNGQTGKVAVDLPIDFKKYIIGSFIISIIIFLLIDNLLVLTPKTISVFSIIAGLVSLVISYAQADAIKTRELHTDDKGFMSKEENKNKKVNVKIFPYIYKELIAMVIPLLALLINFVDDAYYYGSSIIALVLVVLSFYDLVKEHNLLVSNKLPQLEKRGGDESE